MHVKISNNSNWVHEMLKKIDNDEYQLHLFDYTFPSISSDTMFFHSINEPFLIQSSKHA